MAEPTTSKLAVRGCNIGLMRGGTGAAALDPARCERGRSWLPFMRSLRTSSR